MNRAEPFQPVRNLAPKLADAPAGEVLSETLSTRDALDPDELLAGDFLEELAGAP